MATYKIVSCNARTQVALDGEQQFINRVDFLSEKLLSLDADVIGFQELTESMRAQIIARMPTYAFLGAGRDSRRLSEGSVIAVKQSRLIIERLYSDILSPTPSIPGSTYGIDQSSCPRIFSSVDLMPLEGGRPFRLMNVHTDHIGKTARMLEVEQMLTSYYAQNALRPMPTVLTGDFNALPDAPEIKLITNSGIFEDLTNGIKGTFHGFGKCDDLKIDYIFASAEWECRAVNSYRDRKGNLYLSDHDVVEAVVSIED